MRCSDGRGIKGMKIFLDGDRLEEVLVFRWMYLLMLMYRRERVMRKVLGLVQYRDASIFREISVKSKNSYEQKVFRI